MASQSRREPRNRLPRPSPVLAPFTSAAMSTISKPVYTSFLELDICPSRSTRSSGTWASATAVSVVEKGCGATTVDAPVSALNKLDLPLLGRPTRPRRSTPMQATGRPRARSWSAVACALVEADAVRRRADNGRDQAPLASRSVDPVRSDDVVSRRKARGEEERIPGLREESEL